jgi:hypothetical protein
VARAFAPDNTWAMPEGDGPCATWPLAGCSEFPDDVTAWDELMYVSVEVATELLWRLTAGRYGLCEETVRPCRRAPRAMTGVADGAGWMPVLDDGRWLNLTCGCPREVLRTGCGCDDVPQVRLPGPVTLDDAHPITVTVDGVVLPSTAWRLDEPGWLVRVDGQRWPLRQRLDQPTTAEGTWSITYWRGTPVPIAGQMATARYAAEWWRSCTGQDCALPKRVQTISRQGVTYTLIDPRDYLDAGRTGVSAVDQWLAAVNPDSHREPSAVYSPDAARYRQARS